MTKLSWKWFVLIGSVFTFLFYMSITSNAYLSMRHLSLGEPDPFYFIIMGFGLLFTGWFMFVAMAQNISTEIATEVGGFCVHSMDPVETIDPLDRKNMSVNIEALNNLNDSRDDEAKLTLELQKLIPNDVKPSVVRRFHISGDIPEIENYIIEETRHYLKNKILDSWKYKHYMSLESIKEICIKNSWDEGGYEIQRYIREYQAAIDAWKPIGLYPDGGIKLLGIHGFRWWIGGTSLLAVNPEHIIPHGDGGVCITAVKNYTDIEQLQGLPPWLQRGIVDSFPQFSPGKHIVTFGNRPHPRTVRARVMWNKDADDEELKLRPKWIWTLGLQVKPINAEARKKMLKSYGGTLLKEVTTNRKSLEIWGKKKPIPEQKSPEKPEEENDGKEG